MQGERAVGLVSITYDNVGIFCSDADTCLTLRKRILRNCQIYNARVKEEAVVFASAKDMAEKGRAQRFPEYLGLSFAIRTTDGVRSTIWRVADSRMKEWSLASYTRSMACRKIAQWCGRILRFQGRFT